MTSVEQHIEGFQKLGQYFRDIDEHSSQYVPLFECIQQVQNLSLIHI